MNDLTHLDLFSGIGGFSIGFENAGFRTIAFAEVDPDASRVLAHHWPHVPNLGDITKLCRRTYDCEEKYFDGEVWCPRCDDTFGDCACIGTDQFLDEHGWPLVITGGVPCQPASALGSMRGAADERWLWPEALRVVRELRPRFAVFENPPTVLVLPDFHQVIGDITALGYDLWWDVIPAAVLGAGHLRERVLFILADAARDTQRVPHLQADAVPGERKARQISTSGSHPGQLSAHADHPGLQGHARNAHVDGGWPRPHRSIATPYLCDRVQPGHWWDEAHTGIPVLAHGISSKLAQSITRCTGNAIVPEVAQVIAEALRAQLP